MIQISATTFLLAIGGAAVLGAALPCVLLFRASKMTEQLLDRLMANSLAEYQAVTEPPGKRPKPEAQPRHELKDPDVIGPAPA